VVTRRPKADKSTPETKTDQEVPSSHQKLRTEKTGSSQKMSSNRDYTRGWSFRLKINANRVESDILGSSCHFAFSGTDESSDANKE
jgi:hypothetical protein